MNDKLAWGILGTGSIAKTFARGLQHSKTGVLTAVGSRAQSSADRFGDEFNIPHRRSSYEALISDPQVSAVYIALPHPLHAEWAIRAADAKKHLLVEKPMAINAADASAIVEAAIANDVFLMEAYMYRCHPQTARLLELIRSGEIGQVRTIQATFSFHYPRQFDDQHRLLSNRLGGGGILDVGGYPVSLVRLIAGAASEKPFADPIEVKGFGHLGQAGTDEWAAATLKFADGIIAQVAAGVQVNQENAARIYGTDGWILVPSPWVPAREGGTTRIIVHKPGEKEPREVLVETSDWLYAIEADTVAGNLSKRQAQSPPMSWEDSLGNMRALDAWRAQIGLVYESEKPSGYRSTTVAGTALAFGRINGPAMKYGAIPGVNKQISRLVLGCDNQTSFASGAILWDDFFERGGNAFDTAYIYGGGAHERVFGQWVNHRNIREQIVIIMKGAHTPMCTPEGLTSQLMTSLERQRTGYADIYMLHRDNPDVPVGEFVDVLNEHLAAGRIRAFGGSNWSIQRVQQANDYAKAHNKTGFTSISNNFSLARMVDPVWKGCISASDAGSRQWLAQTQIALFPWSSQARGFFLPGRAAPDKQSDAELVRCWYAQDNFQRLARANKLAARRNVLPINIALAYVLNQPFPTFPLIGPRQLNETRTSLPALEIELPPQELRWLNLED
jgi:predicted dehydrogenase/aryl-alcohol dehydrogenase-like predicted oxidoreductase